MIAILPAGGSNCYSFLASPAPSAGKRGRWRRRIRLKTRQLPVARARQLGCEAATKGSAHPSAAMGVALGQSVPGRRNTTGYHDQASRCRLGVVLNLLGEKGFACGVCGGDGITCMDFEGTILVAGKQDC